MKTCDYINCNKEATFSGYIYGHVRGSDDKDNFIPVNACELHYEEDGFYPDTPLKNLSKI